MTDHLRRASDLPAAPGWLRHFVPLFLAALTVLPLYAGPRPDIKGHVVSIHDGDTLTILTPEKKQIKIRLEGIDAPELKQPFGTKAKATLSALVFDKDVVVTDKGTDRYHRTLGRITCGKLDVNLAMVQRGMAWRYEKYSQEAALISGQAEATTKGLGLWANKEQVPPWEWRAKKPTATKGVKSIVDCIHQNCGNGYIWHITGSGKKLTSFKASTLATLRVTLLPKLLSGGLTFRTTIHHRI